MWAGSVLGYSLDSKLADEGEDGVDRRRFQGGAADEGGSEIHHRRGGGPRALFESVRVDTPPNSVPRFQHGHLGSHTFKVCGSLQPSHPSTQHDYPQTRGDGFGRENGHPLQRFLSRSFRHCLISILHFMLVLRLPPLDCILPHNGSQLHGSNFVSTRLQLIHRLPTDCFISCTNQCHEISGVVMDARLDLLLVHFLTWSLHG
mmetsp:Transcript_14211/g.19598  ORF Transcript_14211/g.19598 Transcript_14211/m.19598 type:complete len:203 (+) Transcript_14211:503-1111(+)